MNERAHIESLEDRRHFSSVPTGFYETTVASGMERPTSLLALPDGRLLVTQQTGDLRVIKAGALLPTPAIHLTVDSEAERGLLSAEVDPKFSTNHYLYLCYVGLHKGYTQVSRFVMNGDTVDPHSELTILKIDPQRNGPYHIGGAIHFGRDGKLYVAVGDNMMGTDAQSLTTMHGKLLRINSNGAIPTDNPFYATATGTNRTIYATGLRNAFTSGFDPITGAAYLNDVGENTFEEIDAVRKGANYGWPQTEGPTTAPGIDAPVYAYGPDADGTRASITGGAFYSGVTQQYPSTYAGKYFFGDFVQGFIRTLDPTTKAVSTFVQGLNRIVDIDVAPDGTVLATTYDGEVRGFKFGTDPNQPPTGTASIAGYVINDKNANGKWDSGELGITGRTVWLDLDNDGVLDSSEPTFVTAANGKFNFGNLLAGTYHVREVVPSGSHQTSPANNAALVISLTPGQARSGVSFQVATP